MSDTATPTWTGLDRIRQYAGARRAQSSAERCEFCGVEIAEEHGHVVNAVSRSILCVCRPCYLLFSHEGAGGARFRAVPNRYVRLDDADVVRWEALEIPIGLAFFFRNAATGRVTAFYPSAAGATESELSLGAWDEFVRASPILETLEPDVEALLVQRQGEPMGAVVKTKIASFIVPIDVCYELVGRIRRTWRGFQGGDDVWREIDVFFDGLMQKAQSASGCSP